ncbi:hypothetical protein O77CONTIG1_03605 [Leptolyngbya sp. O-77]|nr:hypothetical protein O77CONTIG1_03605 [Leptolyngbya sp. O-77]
MFPSEVITANFATQEGLQQGVHPTFAMSKSA